MLLTSHKSTKWNKWNGNFFVFSFASFEIFSWNRNKRSKACFEWTSLNTRSRFLCSLSCTSRQDVGGRRVRGSFWEMQGTCACVCFCTCFNVVRENQVKWKYTEIEYCSGYQLRLRFCTVLEITLKYLKNWFLRVVENSNAESIRKVFLVATTLLLFILKHVCSFNRLFSFRTDRSFCFFATYAMFINHVGR